MLTARDQGLTFDMLRCVAVGNPGCDAGSDGGWGAAPGLELGNRSCTSPTMPASGSLPSARGCMDQSGLLLQWINCRVSQQRKHILAKAQDTRRHCSCGEGLAATFKRFIIVGLFNSGSS